MRGGRIALAFFDIAPFGAKYPSVPNRTWLAERPVLFNLLRGVWAGMVVGPAERVLTASIIHVRAHRTRAVQR